MRYPDEFKAKVVNDYRESDLSQDSIAKKYEISSQTVRRWLKDSSLDDIISNLNDETEPLEGTVAVLPHRNTNLETGELKNPKDEDFCRRYILSRERNNAMQCYMDAYDYPMPSDQGGWNKLERLAHEKLHSADIVLRMAMLNKSLHYSEEIVFRELVWIALQKEDMKAKIAAISKFFELKEKYVGGSNGTGNRGYDEAMEAMINAGKDTEV